MAAGPLRRLGWEEGASVNFDGGLVDWKGVYIAVRAEGFLIAGCAR